MRTLLLRAGAIALALIPAIASAQTAASVAAPAGYAPMSAACVAQVDGSCVAVSAAAPLPTGSVRETVRLALANVPSAAQTIYGGTYILTQSCSAYGTLNFQVLGPDGVTFATAASKTASDTGASGTVIGLGSNASVRVTISGTTGCAAILSRVP
ncbi:hypothetical protein [Sphingomonas sp. BK235]|uniref:hypothetical protein n=1 Tax=Sphingomonas sp. BK235 TaxID=2512131 RepID=UPI00104AB6B4|nr:hypothetical protein [Sphingomonas sp. BK235]TCP33287.1 hypothetical protein EV292_106229 [Sphingomonas sp. BK235]